MSNNDRNFDSLAKGLAEGRITRGRALKMLGAALFGGALTTAVPGLAFAQPECKNNAECVAQFGTSSVCTGKGAANARCVCSSGFQTCTNNHCIKCEGDQTFDADACTCNDVPVTITCGGQNASCVPNSTASGECCDPGLVCKGPAGKEKCLPGGG